MVLKFSTIFEQGALCFQLALGLTDEAASPKGHVVLKGTRLFPPTLPGKGNTPISNFHFHPLSHLSSLPGSPCGRWEVGASWLPIRRRLWVCPLPGQAPAQASAPTISVGGLRQGRHSAPRGGSASLGGQQLADKSWCMLGTTGD